MKIMSNEHYPETTNFLLSLPKSDLVGIIIKASSFVIAVCTGKDINDNYVLGTTKQFHKEYEVTLKNEERSKE